jgi:hypothetical protein
MANHDYSAHAQYAAFGRAVPPNKLPTSKPKISGLAALGRYEGASRSAPTQVKSASAIKRMPEEA